MATTEKPSTPNMIYAAMNFKNNDFFNVSYYSLPSTSLALP